MKSSRQEGCDLKKNFSPLNLQRLEMWDLMFSVCRSGEVSGPFHRMYSFFIVMFILSSMQMML